MTLKVRGELKEEGGNKCCRAATPPPKEKLKFKKYRF